MATVTAPPGGGSSQSLPFPVVIAAVHFCVVKFCLFFAPFVTRVLDLRERALTLLTWPYRLFCTWLMLMFLWPLLFFALWVYTLYYLYWYTQQNGQPPEMVTLMGPVGPPPPAPAPALAPAPAPAPAPAQGGVRRRTVAAPSAPSWTAPGASPGQSPAAATADCAPVPTAGAAPAAADAAVPAAQPVSGDSAETSEGGSPAGAEGRAPAKKSIWEPDGYFGPPPPEEGGPEPRYVPLPPGYVDPTDLLPEEELAKYKFYKRRTPLRRHP